MKRVIQPHRRLQGVWSDGASLYTKSLVGHQPVYGEPVIRYQAAIYRKWDARRSKLGAGITNGITQIGIRPGACVLYIGAASGTTVSHVIDIVGDKGYVYAIDISKVPIRTLAGLTTRYTNLVPLCEDAGHPEQYAHLLEPVDVVFQDVAQRDQTRIFMKNCTMFLKKEGFGLLSCKARSIDVTAQPKKIFDQVATQLERNRLVIVDKRSLEPFQKGHMLFVVKKR